MCATIGRLDRGDNDDAFLCPASATKHSMMNSTINAVHVRTMTGHGTSLLAPQRNTHKRSLFALLGELVAEKGKAPQGYDSSANRSC